MKRPEGGWRKWGGIVLASALVVLSLPSVIKAKDHGYEVTSPHFIVVSNAREDVALEVAKQFEQIRIVISKDPPRGTNG